MQLSVQLIEAIAAKVSDHPGSLQCLELECFVCGYRDCPHQDPLHYCGDCCPRCSVAEEDSDET